MSDAGTNTPPPRSAEAPAKVEAGASPAAGEYSTADCTIIGSTPGVEKAPRSATSLPDVVETQANIQQRTTLPGVEKAPRASLSGGEGQGNALSSADEDPALPAAQPGADSGAGNETATKAGGIRNTSSQEGAGQSAHPHASGRAVNQTELAQVMGVTDVTLWEWQKLDGFPILQRGARGQSNWYDTAAVIAWKINYEVKKASGPESQKDRLARLQADRIEIELAELRGESIPADRIEPVWIAIVSAVKQALLPLGLRLAPILETTSGVDAKRELIDEEVFDALTKLSAYGGTEFPAGPGVQGDAALRASEADLAEEMG